MARRWFTTGEHTTGMLLGMAVTTEPPRPPTDHMAQPITARAITHPLEPMRAVLQPALLMEPKKWARHTTRQPEPMAPRTRLPTGIRVGEAQPFPRMENPLTRNTIPLPRDRSDRFKPPTAEKRSA